MNDPFAELDTPLPTIKVTCTSTDCENDQHCYLQKKKVDGAHVFGDCRSCGVPPTFDITRIRKRDIGDVDYTFAAMRNEMIRERYWTKPFDEKAASLVRKRGKRRILEGIASRLRSSIGREANRFDGLQTKLEGNVIFYAQHATATCCRKCLSYWHDIPANRDLTVVEARYCEALCAEYLERRLPEIDAAA